VFIGAPDLDSLAQCWKEITGLDLVRHEAQYIHVFSGKARDAAAAETSQSLERAMTMSTFKFPDGWSCVGSGIAEYTTPLFYIGFGDSITLSLKYRYAINQYGQKMCSPFKHDMGGTYTYREFSLWRLCIGVSTKTR
jgi:hypothetical protein